MVGDENNPIKALKQARSLTRTPDKALLAKKTVFP